MSQQQTVLRVETNIPDLTLYAIDAYEFTFLDLYGDIPIKINKSFAELQDISKKNSDYSIGLTLPGSKRNNRFFEDFYNVDAQTLYFNPTERVNCSVLLNDEVYFRGYLRLNKINVINSKVEYDVTLYSTVGNLFGEIGNNLLQDLNFDDTEYTFNHIFSQTGVTNLFGQSNFYKDSEYPYTYFYPIVHNGYNYTNVTGTTGGTSNVYLPNFSGNTTGATLLDQTRLYTSTSPIGSWNSYTAATASGVEEYRINSPIYGLRDNQLKPGLNIWSLIKLIFKTYGYTIKSDFMNTPWMKSLYLYGYFSYEGTKFGWKVNNIQSLPLEGVQILYDAGSNTIVVVKANRGIPCYALEDINYGLTLIGPGPSYTPQFENGVIRAGTSGVTVTITGTYDFLGGSVPISTVSLRYLPKAVGDSKIYIDGDAVDFSLVVDQNIKQIDILSSIAKKFNLIFIADPDVPNQIIVEPYDFYVGTGNIYDWTPYLSWDKGFTVEPALNFIESTLLLTDQEDGDEGNREFKNRVNRIYGRNIVYNPTDFKSQEKKIDTIFSPELIRKWDDNIGLPLGINYSATSKIDPVDNQIRWQYNGVKSKPKIFYWVGTANPFIDDVNEVYSTTGTSYNTYTVKVLPSNYTGSSIYNYERIPVVSHTMPMGLSDADKINNDSLSILFNSELPVDIGVQTYNTYTENDVYNTFYRTRINNIYNPNTRMVSGYFDLKYSDIQNFQWNDIIKINEQYFTVNKISEFNLTNRELTKVELIQFNLNPQQYVDRYFKYTYCDQPGYCFKLKTDFTNPNLQDTNFIWSTYYDQQVGSLTGTTTGFTSTFRVFNTSSFQVQYVPYTMQEITETDYVSGSCYDSSFDTMLNYIYGSVNGLNYSLTSFWENTAVTFKGTNLWPNCAGFNATNSTYGITTGSSTNYGPPITPTPTTTPTPTPTATPTPTPSPTPTLPIPPLPTSTPTPTGAPTSTPTPTPTITLTPTPTPTPDPSTLRYFIGSVSNYHTCELVNASGQTYLASCPGGWLQLSYDSGVSFVNKEWSDLGWSDINMDENGQNIIAVGGTGAYIYKSSDYGQTFSYLTPTDILKADISSNGKYIAAAKNKNGNSYASFSSDSGSTFTDKLISSNDANIIKLKISNNGQFVFLICVDNYGSTSNRKYKAYLSSDYGVTYTCIFNQGGLTTIQLYDCDMSQEADRIILSANTGLFNRTEHQFSTDFGVTWYGTDSSNVPQNSLCATTSTGQYGLFSTNDFWDTYGGYNMSGITGAINSGALNAYGDFGVVGTTLSLSNGHLELTTDYGATWTFVRPNNFSGNYNAVAVSKFKSIVP